MDIPVSEERNLTRNRVSFALKSRPEGQEIIWLQAYYLKSERKFGFLIDFRFKKDRNVPFSKRVQQLSLSLDGSGRENRNFYADRHNKVQHFIQQYFDSVFPLNQRDSSIEVAWELISLPSEALDRKRYVFGGEKTHASQFLGIKQFRPLVELEENPGVFVVYRRQDRSLSVDLYNALRGRRFPQVFPGTESMFGFSLNNETVKGIAVSDFKKQEMERVRDTVLSSDSKAPLVLLVAPWDEESVEDSQDYFQTKHIFISARIPSQVVRLHTLQRDSRLQWSTSGIALQCFAKLGGQPWKVQPRQSRCLIIGLGQSHRESFHSGKRQIEKYYAYSILTDSSGLFKELRVLGHSENSQDYLTQLRNNIAEIVEDYNNEFDRYVIHAPYKIRKDELDKIEEVFSSFTGDSNKQFVVLRVNSQNSFFGYNYTNNSLVPFESTYAALARDEYLVWFEGLQYRNPKVSKRYSGPVHIAFHYSTNKLPPSEQLDYLQDTVNLSGANWRGFNAKNLPVSIYYAQLIARFTNKFEEIGLAEVELDNLNPWFL